MGARRARPVVLDAGAFIAFERIRSRPLLLLLAAAVTCCGGRPPAVEPPAHEIPPPAADAGTPPLAASAASAASAPSANAAAPPADAGAPLPQPATLTIDERAQIASSALELALVEKAIPDYGLLKNPKKVVLAVDNLEGAAPVVKGVELSVMSADAIRAKADREGDFLFLAFGPIEMQADGAVHVSLRNTWALGAASRQAGKIIMSGGGMALRFRREGPNRNAWKREVLMKWIS